MAGTGRRRCRPPRWARPCGPVGAGARQRRRCRRRRPPRHRPGRPSARAGWYCGCGRRYRLGAGGACWSDHIGSRELGVVVAQGGRDEGDVDVREVAERPWRRRCRARFAAAAGADAAGTRDGGGMVTSASLIEASATSKGCCAHAGRALDDVERQTAEAQLVPPTGSRSCAAAVDREAGTGVDLVGARLRRTGACVLVVLRLSWSTMTKTTWRRRTGRFGVVRRDPPRAKAGVDRAAGGSTRMSATTNSGTMTRMTEGASSANFTRKMSVTMRVIEEPGRSRTGRYAIFSCFDRWRLAMPLVDGEVATPMP